MLQNVEMCFLDVQTRHLLFNIAINFHNIAMTD